MIVTILNVTLLLQIKLGNKLLVYISCCLAGRAYPLGDIPPNLVDTVKAEVFKCVTVLHTKDGTEGMLWEHF